MTNPIYLILLISVLGPILGSLIGIWKKPSDRFMFNMLSFAAGVMLAISFLELIPEAIEFSNILTACLGITIGALAMWGVDKVIPHLHPGFCSQEQGCSLKKTSVYLILGIFLHNFPEGMAIASGEVIGGSAMILIALAIAIHNIPEGICTSAPFYKVTKKRLKSFLVSSSTAIPIVIGFFVAKFIFTSIGNSSIGFIVAATAGLMIYISADELIPTSCKKNQGHTTIFSLILGILFVILLGLL